MEGDTVYTINRNGDSQTCTGEQEIQNEKKKWTERSADTAVNDQWAEDRNIDALGASESSLKESWSSPVSFTFYVIIADTAVCQTQ